jgi:transposase
MSRRMVSVDRDTPMLMPPSIQEWVGKDDMARFVVEAVEAVEESSYRINWRGSGDAQYSPRMMLGLLVYCYAHGIFSSRKIETATYRDIAVRFICGDNHPDHDTIAAFRRENRVLFSECFAKVLHLARALEIKRVGDVALDGSVIAAAASRRKVRSKKEIEEELDGLKEKVEGLIARAEESDEGESDGSCGRKLPKELERAQTRQAKLREALEHLKEATQERAKEREIERKNFDPEGPGEAPKALAKEPGEKDTVTVGEPDAQLMPGKKGGCIPAYNVQAAVQADCAAPLILAQAVSTKASDRRQLASMVDMTMVAAPETERILVDTGYDNSAQIFEVERKHRVTVYCPPQASDRPEGKGKQTTRRKRTAQYRKAMRACLRSEFGRSSRQLRATTVEPVFGWIKKTLGFERFSLQGLPKVQTEWALVCLAFNLKLLHRRKGRK